MNNYFIIKPREKTKKVEDLEENKKNLFVNHSINKNHKIHANIYHKLKNTICLNETKY